MDKAQAKRVKEINSVLLHLTKLLKQWGFSTKDWMMIGQYPYTLLGYATPIREGHFNILIKKDVVPWDFDSSAIEIHPPVNSRFSREFEEFTSKTGYAFDLIPFSKNRFSDWIQSAYKYNMAPQKNIYIQSEQGAVKEYSFLLPLLINRDGYGPEKGKRIIDNISIFRDKFKLNDKLQEAKALTKLINKYSAIIKDANNPIPTQDTKRIQGTPACGGIAKGLVKIVLDPENTQPLQEGTILVTPMTSGRFLPILQGVSAIITDEGGMLCHAAIISRELDIPCIVGAKIATKTLQDGDTVEVDANKGNIKILKRAE